VPAHRSRRALALALVALVALVALASPPALAAVQRADRSQPMVVEADREGVLDLQRQVLVYTGNVVVQQGSMVLRADRVELRTLEGGYRAASAIGTPERPATWRQKREGLDESVEGAAERIEFDARADTLRFIGQGAVRRLRGAVVADEITGARILWDNGAEVFRVEGGAVSQTNPTGRVRAVLSPRDESSAASAPEPARPPTTPLEPSRTLGRPASAPR
jgi:lipopolysaccharide export system protein LptA